MNHSRLKILGEQLKAWFRLLSVSDRRSSWQVVCAGILSCALALAVATRYTNYVRAGTGHSTTVAQHDEGTKRQHIDKSSFTWTFSFTDFARVEPPRRNLRAALFDPPAVPSVRDENLYNRPPPSL
jgi:hypothetical protein